MFYALGMQTIEEVFQGCGSEENSPKRLPPRGDAFGESLGTWLSLLYVYQCSKPCLFFISGRGTKPLIKEKLSYVANSLNEDW